MVFLAAAQDSEESLATVRGSLFTLALQQAVMQGANTSPSQLIAAAELTLANSVPAEHRFHPSLIGDPALLVDKGLFVAPAGEQQRADRLLWEQWFDLVKYGEPLQVQPSREVYQDGQLLGLDVEMPHAGYLNIVTVNPEDQVTVLFPNAIQRDNYFEAGLIELPKKGFDWPAGKPYGDSLIVSLVSEEPINLFASSHQRDKQGNALGAYLRPEMADAERFKSLAAQDDSGLSTNALMLTVCGPAGCQ